MTENLCLLCNHPESKAKPRPDKDFVCSRCVQDLLRTAQEAIQEAIVKAIQLGKERQATALQMFKEDENVGKQSRPTRTRRNHHRGRAVTPAWREAYPDRSFAPRQAIAIRERGTG